MGNILDVWKLFICFASREENGENSKFQQKDGVGGSGGGPGRRGLQPGGGPEGPHGAEGEKQDSVASFGRLEKKTQATKHDAGPSAT